MGHVTDDQTKTRPAPTSAFYSIETQVPDLVCIKILNFWPRDTMVEFTRDVTRTVLELSCPPGRYRVMCDVTDSALQSQVNCDDFIRLLTDDRAAPARSIAVVTRNPASRMQVRRLIAGQENAALFKDEESAIDWLTSRANEDV